MPVVVDASATLAWCFENDATAASDALWLLANSEGLLVPAHWRIEIASVLLIGERRRRINRAQSDEFLWLLDMLLIEVDAVAAATLSPPIMTLAREASWTAYDAAYLELALRHGLPLATRDQALATAASARGVTLLPA